MSSSSPAILAWILTIAQFSASDEIEFDLITPSCPIPKSLHVSLPIQSTVREGLDLVIKLLSQDDHQPQDNLSTKLRSLLVIWDESTQDHPLQEYGQVVLCRLMADDDPHIQGWAKEDQWKCNQMVHQMRHILSLLRQADTHSQLSSVMSVSTEHVHQIQYWNHRPLPREDTCIHHRIEQQCHLRGDAPAVCAWDGGFTYEELDQVATHFAAYIQTRGVRPEVFVPLYLTKSRWTTVAILAVLKAGGAFVLLDPSHPVDRLRIMCHDVGASLVLSSPRDADSAATLGLPIVELGPSPPPILETQMKSVTVRPDNAAYICFTSGSTGTPKGAVIEHSMLSTVATAHGPALLMGPQSRVFQFASYAFDASILENLITLTYGGCVCVPSEQSRRDDIPGAFMALQANYMFITPSVLQVLSPATMPGLHHLLVGGESIGKPLIKPWQETAQVVACYGPTECSIICVAHGPVSEGSDPRVLGNGLACHLWIEDTRNPGKLAPVGAVGELVIEGPIVGRGYIKAPSEKLAAFLPPGAWKSAGPDAHQAYRTGDLVQYIDANGSVRFVGRKDTQVKIRGQRVELSEIEHHLRRLFFDVENVLAEVVTPAVRPDPILVALVQTNSSSDSSYLLPPCQRLLSNWLHLIRPQMQTSLPQYMVPSVVIPLARTPLTMNGKADRRRLRAMVEQLSKEELDAYTMPIGMVKRQPETETGRCLQAAIAEILDLQPEAIGLDDDFLRLGGNSVSAMKLVSRLREMHVSLSVGDILQNPVVEAIANRAMAMSNGHLSNHAGVVPFSMLPCSPVKLAQKLGIAEDEIVDALPATEQQQAMLKFPPQFLFTHIPGPVDVEKLEVACQKLVDRHSILRTVFVEHDGVLFQTILRKAAIPFVRHECPEDYQDMRNFEHCLCKDDLNRPLPKNAPPIRFLLASQQNREYSLIMNVNHSSYDGESWRVLERDLSALYNGHTLGPAVPFAPWAYTFFSHAKSAETLGFWETLLKGSSMTYVGDPFCDLGENVEEVSIEACRMIPVLDPPAGFTAASLVKAAWALTLSDYCQTADVVFGQNVHGRGHGFPNEEAVIGPCLNQIPVRMNLGGIENGADLLSSIHDQHINSMAYDRVQLRDIVARSTSWPANTMLGTLVMHQYGTYDSEPMFEDVRGFTRFMFIPRIAKELRDFAVLSIVTDETHILQIATTNAFVDQQSAESLIDSLVSYMQRLARDPKEVVVRRTFGN
ncbi:non-ribosomal peptide synthase [Aspergillus sclerotialis]|uniref:Non-ribosomal peptide synthase n=1 Tax=Aspergillus sclerotialis TaxID=2070753 RepID=A0A3A2ZJ86_9EURO|nr:non-ribosomal peptide synthase [Aspergillus sclerotialis]